MISELFKNPITEIAFLPFYIIGKVVMSILLGCPEPQKLTAANLITAKFKLAIAAQEADASLSQFHLLKTTQAWHSNVNWKKRHYYSSAGAWQNQGGTFDSAFDLTGSLSSDNKTIEFDVTDYFKDLLSQTDPTHFGFAVTSTTNNASVDFHSSNSSSGTGPRLYAEYQACPTSSGSLGHTYFLKEKR